MREVVYKDGFPERTKSADGREESSNSEEYGCAPDNSPGELTQ